MIKVLRSWDDLGQAILALQPKNAYHADPLKNWDLAQIGELVAGLPRTSRILDAGCSESYCSLLRYVYRLGFRDLVGVDLHVSVDDRIQQALLMKSQRSLRTPFKLVEGNLLATDFADRSFDVVICLSVIEHEVDPGRFFAEMCRMLRPGGLLYVSTDYWPTKIDTTGLRHWGLAWTIFAKDEIEALLGVAAAAGFDVEGESVPPAGEPIVQWSGKQYTFISLAMRKRQDA